MNEITSNAKYLRKLTNETKTDNAIKNILKDIRIKGIQSYKKSY